MEDREQDEEPRGGNMGQMVEGGGRGAVRKRKSWHQNGIRYMQENI